MFLHHRAHFLLPNFFPPLPPFFFHPLKVAKKRSESASRKSPLLISLVSVGVSVRACVCKLWTMSTAQWTQQCSKGVKCEIECVWPDSYKGIGCQQQRAMWSSLRFHCSSTLALTRTETACKWTQLWKRDCQSHILSVLFPVFLGLSFTWLNMKAKNDW